MNTDDRDFLLDAALPESWRKTTREVQQIMNSALQDALLKTLSRFPADDQVTAFALLNAHAIHFGMHLRSALEAGFLRKERLATVLARIEAYATMPQDVKPS